MKNNTLNFLTKMLVLITLILFMVLGIQKFIKKESNEYRLKIAEKIVTFEQKIAKDVAWIKKILWKFNIVSNNINEIKQFYLATTELLIYQTKPKNLASFLWAIATVRKIKNFGNSKGFDWKIKEYLNPSEIKTLSKWEKGRDFLVWMKKKGKEEETQLIDLINFNIRFHNINYHKNEIKKIIIY